MSFMSDLYYKIKAPLCVPKFKQPWGSVDALESRFGNTMELLGIELYEHVTLRQVDKIKFFSMNAIHTIGNLEIEWKSEISPYVSLNFVILRVNEFSFIYFLEADIRNETLDKPGLYAVKPFLKYICVEDNHGLSKIIFSNDTPLRVYQNSIDSTSLFVNDSLMFQSVIDSDLISLYDVENREVWLFKEGMGRTYNSWKQSLDSGPVSQMLFITPKILCRLFQTLKLYSKVLKAHKNHMDRHNNRHRLSRMEKFNY